MARPLRPLLLTHNASSQRNAQLLYANPIYYYAHYFQLAHVHLHACNAFFSTIRYATQGEPSFSRSQRQASTGQAPFSADCLTTSHLPMLHLQTQLHKAYTNARKRSILSQSTRTQLFEITSTVERLSWQGEPTKSLH